MTALRQAIPDDAPAIADIWNHEIRGGVSTFNAQEKSTDEIATMIISHPRDFVVAHDHDQILGFGTLSQFRSGVGYAHTMEHTLYVDPIARGRGIGRILIRQLEDMVRLQGAHSLLAGIGSENSGGIAFHVALGFQEVARLPEVGQKFGRWMDLVLMQKFI